MQREVSCRWFESVLPFEALISSVRVNAWPRVMTMANVRVHDGCTRTFFAATGMMVVELKIDVLLGCLTKT